MNVTVRLFARARDLAGAERVELQLSENATVADLRQALCRECPDLAPLAPHMLVAVGNDYADDKSAIPAGIELACFPPVSGG